MLPKAFRKMSTILGTFLGRAELVKLKHYCKKANKKQEKLLLKLMRDNESTIYGMKNNFDKVKSVEDYQSVVPLSTYADYEEYVQQKH